MKILKLKLFQEVATYKKPYALKVEEVYPLPPYSTVIGFLHNILEVKNGEKFNFNVSIQGTHESVNHNYVTKSRFASEAKKKEYKKKYGIDIDATTFPYYNHFLFNVNLVIHVQAEDDIINKLYNNILNGKGNYVLGNNSDMVRLDEVKIVSTRQVNLNENIILKYDAYIPEKYLTNKIPGQHYKLNTYYKIDSTNQLRIFQKENVVFVEEAFNKENSEESIANSLKDILIDEENDYLFLA
jgi:CRISPR-associated protein Cas5t